MILDRGHLRWAVFSAVLLVAGTASYLVYLSQAPGGPAAGSFMGLTYGIVGTVFILFAALLGVRKKRPHYRWGRVAFWLKGHLWLGALSFPLILFHSGFEFGGAVTQILMWLFMLVFATGLWGLALQQVLPRLMSKNVPQETVYEQIDHVRRRLLEEAQEMARGGKKAAVSRAKAGGKVSGRVVKGHAATEEEGNAGGDERAPVVRFVEEYLRPFFSKHGIKDSPLLNPHRRAALFDDLRRVVDEKLHGVTHDLDALCEQRSQLEVQRKLHHWLHGWLLIHVPLSWTMVFLTVVHAFMSLYY